MKEQNYTTNMQAVYTRRS